MSRNVILRRERRFVGGGIDWDVYVDGIRFAALANGKELIIPISESSHQIYYTVDEPTGSGGTQRIHSDVINIPNGLSSYRFRLYFKMGLFHGIFLFEEE